MPASVLSERPMRPPVMVLLALCLALAAALVPLSGAHAATGSAARRAAAVAVNQIGDPYRYGARGPGAFDCSGLVQYSYQRAGVRSVPRTASAQARASRHIAKSNLRRGDLMFFTNGGGVYHVAIFLGWDRGRAVLVHAPYPGRRVQRTHVWTSHWFAGTFRG